MQPTLLINADNDHYFCEGGRGPEQMTVEAMQSYIDEIAAGGKVSHIFFCAQGQRSSYNSSACEPIWTGPAATDERNLRWQRNAKLCFDRGIDPYKVWIDRSRELGISPWISMRMNDVHGVTTRNCFRVTDFWKDHPELRRDPVNDPYKGGSGWGNFAFDYAHQEVRDYHFAIFKELVDRYSPDGIELDWMRFPFLLRPGHEKEDAHFITEFMRQCRAYLSEKSLELRAKSFEGQVGEVQHARDGSFTQIAPDATKRVPPMLCTSLSAENDRTGVPSPAAEIEHDSLKLKALSSKLNNSALSTQHSALNNSNPVQAPPIQLSVRVPPRLSSAIGFGMDPVQWAAEGLVDLIVPTNFIQAYDFRLNLREWQEEVGKVNPAVKVIPGGANMCSCASYDGAVPLPFEIWKGWCDVMFSYGGDGIYLFNADYLDKNVKARVYAEGIGKESASRGHRRYLASFDDCAAGENADLGLRCPFPTCEGKSIVIPVGTAETAVTVSVIAAFSEDITDPPALTLNGQAPISAPLKLNDMRPFCAKFAKSAFKWDFAKTAVMSGDNTVIFPPGDVADKSLQTVWCEIELK